MALFANLERLRATHACMHARTHGVADTTGTVCVCVCVYVVLLPNIMDQC